MKSILFSCVIAAACISFVSCEKTIIDEGNNEKQESNVKTKNFTFKVKGDFENPTFTRASTTVQESSMTDVWFIDCMAGTMIQQKHLTKTDAEWTAPKLALKYGLHHIYIVSSAGESPTLSTDAGTIIWTKPRDTFYKDYEVEVTSSSNGNRSVTLTRIATMFRIKVADEVPNGISKVDMTPTVWYYGLNYVTGEACESSNAPFSITVPSSYVGTSGNMNMSFYGIGTSVEFSTDVTVNATNASGTSLGSVTITGAPMQRNRVTEYGGSLFHSEGAFSMTLNTDWSDPYTGKF